MCINITPEMLRIFLDNDYVLPISSLREKVHIYNWFCHNSNRVIKEL